jgi:MFS family permease
MTTTSADNPPSRRTTLADTRRPRRSAAGPDRPAGSGQPTHHGTLVAACAAVFIAQLGLVLPAAINGEMQRALQTSGSELTWISAAFLVPIAMLSLTFGLLGDLYGRKKLLVAGSVAMTIGFAVSAMSNDVHTLWLGQAIAGIGAAILFATSLALVTFATPGARQRAIGLAAWTTALSTGALVAPPMSGLLTEHYGFNWAFGVSAVVAAVTVLTGALLSRDSRAPEGRALDWPGQLSIAGSLLALLFGVIEGPELGWTSPAVAGALLVSAVLLVVFIMVETRTAKPLLRLDLFRIPSFAAAAVVSVIGMFGFLGGAYVLSIRLGVIQHQSTVRAAIPFLIIQAVTPFIWPLLVRLLRLVGPRIMIVTGLVAIAAGQLLLLATPITATGIGSIMLSLILNGIGFGLLVSALTAAAVNAVPLNFAGMASATSSMMRDLGQTLAPAIIGTVALTQAAPLALAGLRNADGLAPAQLGAAEGILAEGGPLALATVPLGPQVTAAASDALAHGYDRGLLVTALSCLVGALVAAVFLRGGKAPATQQAGH